MYRSTDTFKVPQTRVLFPISSVRVIPYIFRPITIYTSCTSGSRWDKHPKRLRTTVKRVACLVRMRQRSVVSSKTLITAASWPFRFDIVALLGTVDDSLPAESGGLYMNSSFNYSIRRAGCSSNQKSSIVADGEVTLQLRADTVKRSPVLLSNLQRNSAQDHFADITYCIELRRRGTTSAFLQTLSFPKSVQV